MIRFSLCFFNRSTIEIMLCPSQCIERGGPFVEPLIIDDY